MTDQKRPIAPLLIPSPSPMMHNERRDPFDNLFSDPGQSMPLFSSTKRMERPGCDSVPSTASSATSEFGVFVSVPPSMDPLQQAVGDDLLSFSSPVEAPSSEFFERFIAEAKERTGENERRVLDELLQHEDDPMYWLKSNVSHQEENPSENVSITGILDEASPTSSPLPSPSPSPSQPLERTPSPREPKQLESITPTSKHPPDSPMTLRNSPPSSLSSSTATLSRKWMSSLLSHSVPSPARTTAHDRTASQPQFVTPRRGSIASLTHSSPFAAHIFTPPSGAPGFTGDRLWNQGKFEFEVEAEEKHHVVQLTGRREETTPVLTSGVAEQLRRSFPALPRLAKTWSLLYSLDQHGVSLQTFYAKCASRTSYGTLISMRDSEDRVFGVWMGEQVRMSPGAYYGSGESFLWTNISHHERDQVEVFKWTGKNEYVALCESDFISFGGGEGKYGLYLDSSLINGSSARCPTFNNEVLCASIGHDTSKTVPFECVGLEAWAIVP